jgi:hypothetical protein
MNFKLTKNYTDCGQEQISLRPVPSEGDNAEVTFFSATFAVFASPSVLLRILRVSVVSDSGVLNSAKKNKR